MSLFEKIKNKTITEVTDREYKKQLQKDAKKSAGQEEKFVKKEVDKGYKTYLKRKAKQLNTTPAALEKSVDKGIRAVNRTAGKPLPKQGYAGGEPFQPDNNPKTINDPDPQVRGKYPASGRSTLKGRMRYPSVEKGGETKLDVKKRLGTRIDYALKGTREGQSKAFNTATKRRQFVDYVTKNQPALSKATGKDSTLYKTLKKYIDAKEPTVASKSKAATGKFGIKKGKTLKLPMPDGPKKDALVKKNLQKFDADIVKKAKIPKGVTLPKGGTRTSAPIDPKEFNLQFKADKLKLDYGGRFAKRDGLTAAQRKKELKDLKRKLNIKNPTIVSPVTNKPLPATAANMKKYGFIPTTKPITQPLKEPRKIKKILSTKTPAYNPYKSTSRFKKVMTALKKNPKTALAAAAIGTGVYLYNRGKNNPKGIIPPPSNKGKIRGAKGVDIKFTLGGGDPSKGFKYAGRKDTNK